MNGTRKIAQDKKRSVTVPPHYYSLILNAAQAIDADNSGAEGVIKIRSYRDGDFVCCSVEDNGTGIPENHSGYFQSLLHDQARSGFLSGNRPDLYGVIDFGGADGG